MNSNHQTGQNGEFYWIEFLLEYNGLSKLITNHPTIFEKKYLAIVCFDGGRLVLEDEEKVQGWYEKGEIAYSPLLNASLIDDLPCDQFDQWCLFSTATEFSGMTSFVNYVGFTLTGRRHELQSLDNTQNRTEKEGVTEHLEELTEQFWEEMRIINPVSFISEGSKFIFVSKNIEEIELVKNNFK